MRSDQLPILIDGVTRLMSYDQARAMLNEHEARACESLCHEARHLAMAGWIILQIAQDRRYGVFEAIADRLNIHRNRVDRMRRYAEVYVDPATGRFEEDRWYAAVEVARQRADSGERPCKRAADGTPSMKAVEEAAGIRHPNPDVRVDPNQTPPGGRFVREEPNKSDPFGDDPFDSALDSLPPAKPRLGPRPEFLPGAGSTAAARADIATGCVGATQPDLPWHLAESARTLAERAAVFEAAVARGEIEHAVAHDIQARIDALLHDIGVGGAVGGGVPA